jgi:DNA-binding beta-propeller fold protein YncE
VPGKFGIPAGIAIDLSRRVLVADYTNHRIQRFTADGVYVDGFGALGSKAGQLNLPIAVAVAGNGPILVAEAGNMRVQRFDATGAPAGFLSVGLEGPFGVTLDGAGLVLVAETAANRITPFDDPSTPALRTTWGALKRRFGPDNENGRPR